MKGVPAGPQENKTLSESLTWSWAPGQNFVDLNLQVLVKQAECTAIAFQPDHLYGTTVGNGATNHIISINFLCWLAEAWKIIEDKGTYLVSDEGAGQGPRD